MSANFGIAAIAGLGGALAMTIFMYILVAFGFRIDVLYLIGSRFVDPSDSGKVYTVGLIVHLLIGIIWGLIYVLLMIGMVEDPRWTLGIQFGVAHGLFVGVVISTFADSHPYVGPDKAIPDPGMFGNRWGKSIPFIIVLLHIVYGLAMTMLYNQLYQPEFILRM
jgi:hypothetical protein